MQTQSGTLLGLGSSSGIGGGIGLLLGVTISTWAHILRTLSFFFFLELERDVARSALRSASYAE